MPIREELRYRGIPVSVTINTAMPDSAAFVQKQLHPLVAYRVFVSCAVRASRLGMLIDEFEARRARRGLDLAQLAAAIAELKTEGDAVPSAFILPRAVRDQLGPARVLEPSEATSVLGIPLRVDASLPPDVIGMETGCATCRGTGWARHSPWPCADCIGGKRLTLHRIAP
jgi:hypothetical protein